MPLFLIKFPANANTLILFLIDIATFDIFPSDNINSGMIVLPESEPYNINFQAAEIDGVYAITNIGTMLYIIVFYIALIIIERIWNGV